MRYLALVKKWRSNTLQVADKRIHQIPLLAGTPAICHDPVERGETSVFCCEPATLRSHLLNHQL